MPTSPSRTGSTIDFVDVPGHDALIGNMLVGAGEIDAVMLVVAADDGPRAQTLEHLELLDALGLRDGVAVVTKGDVVGPERAAEVADAVAALLAPDLARRLAGPDRLGDDGRGCRSRSRGAAAPPGPAWRRVLPAPPPDLDGWLSIGRSSSRAGAPS